MLGTKSLIERWGCLQLWRMTSTSVCTFVKNIFVRPFLHPTIDFPFSFSSWASILIFPAACQVSQTYTQRWVCLDICDCVLGIYACMYMTVVSRICASVHRCVHSLSTDSHLSFYSDTPCDGFWPDDEFLIKVNDVSVSTVADDSGSYFKRHFIRYRAAARRDKNHL